MTHRGRRRAHAGLRFAAVLVAAAACLATSRARGPEQARRSGDWLVENVMVGRVGCAEIVRAEPHFDADAIRVRAELWPFQGGKCEAVAHTAELVVQGRAIAAQRIDPSARLAGYLSAEFPATPELWTTAREGGMTVLIELTARQGADESRGKLQFDIVPITRAGRPAEPAPPNEALVPEPKKSEPEFAEPPPE